MMTETFSYFMICKAGFSEGHKVNLYSGRHGLRMYSSRERSIPLFSSLPKFGLNKIYFSRFSNVEALRVCTTEHIIIQYVDVGEKTLKAGKGRKDKRKMVGKVYTLKGKS